ncbi:MAG: hypothetical protein DWQ36_01480 [Acidobacteria bacterium]|nr:MAG: hypothetical protein DWQ36_01480 [Acidobacteriota bacterium]
MEDPRRAVTADSTGRRIDRPGPRAAAATHVARSAASEPRLLATLSSSPRRRLKPARQFALLLLAVLAPAAGPRPPAAAQSATAASPVEIDAGPLGTLIGEEVGDVIVLRGIPYAAPPIGELRWRPPQPLDLVPSQRGERMDASRFGAACPQPSTSRAAASLRTSEDCLTLNLWTSAPSGSRPVMVWIHGGGLRTGSGSSSIYDGSHLVREGVVLVTFNYRLGALGFLADPRLTEAAAGVANFGMLDMVEALRWVRRHIAAFGGDPERVTIFGESAGGMAVQMLMASPRSAGLFHRAASLSGYGTWPLPRTDDAGRELDLDAFELGSAILRQAGAAADADAAALRRLDAEALAAAGPSLHLPVVDGATLPDEPAAVFEHGRQHDVPLVVGGNSYDGAVMMMAGRSPEEYLASWSAEDREQLRALYRDDFAVSEQLGGSRIFGDARYLLAARTVARGMARVSAPAYLYYFAYVPRSLRERVPGAPHAVEVGLLFGNPSPLSGAADDEARAVGATLRGLLVRLAATGDPNGGDLEEQSLSWPAHDAVRDSWLVLGDAPVVRSGVLRARLDFLERWYRLRRTSLESVSGSVAGD